MRHTRTLLCAALFLAAPLLAASQDTAFKAALDKYDTASRAKDVETVKGLLAADVLLYEHSVKNDGLQDVFENHLKPEILESKDMQIEHSDLRITQGAELTLVTRQFRVRGQIGERTVDTTWNETLVWKKVGGAWKIAHIHWSNATPRRQPPAKQP